MLNAAALVRPLSPEPSPDRTLDLAALAGVARGDRVIVDFGADRTQELFERTLQVVADHTDDSAPIDGQQSGLVEHLRRCLPDSADLRQRFLFAETIGGYATLHDLLNGHSPAMQLFNAIDDTIPATRLSDRQVALLEAYRQQVEDALAHASRYLAENFAQSYTADELLELNEVLHEARDRFDRVNELLGINLIRQVEHAVLRLDAMSAKIRSVQTASDGTFLVDSEVMFLPTNELIGIVNVLFNAIGNPYVARHVDGLLLLAARNLLISVVSFYAYYGRQQIYNVVKKNKTTFSRAAITHYIRMEIRELFKACKAENRLVLRRVMANAERQFEISVDSLRVEAEATAMNVVDQLLPANVPPSPPVQKTLLQRIVARLFR